MRGLHCQGTVKAPIAFLQFPKEKLQVLLPKGLVLEEPPLVDKDKHIAIFMFGRHENVRGVLGEIDLPSLIRKPYNEFVLAIPFVFKRTEKGAKSGPYVFMHTLYLDNFAATVIGFVVCGYNKYFRNIDNTHNEYAIKKKFSDNNIVNAKFSHDNNGKPFFNNKPVEDLLKKMFHQPIISKHFLSWFLTTTFDWNYEKMKREPISISLEISHDFLDGAFTGNYTISPFSSNIGSGAFNLETDYSISFPAS